MSLKLSITKRIYLMLLFFVLFSLASVVMKYLQSQQTVKNFQTMQEKQYKLILIADKIKTKLSEIQNIQVQSVVDAMTGVNSVTDNQKIDISKEFNEFKEYFQRYNSKELEELYKKIDYRYQLLNQQFESLDMNDIKGDSEEAIMVIEGIIAIAGKMNEEVSSLIDISHSELKNAMVEINKNIEKRVMNMFIFNMIVVVALIMGGIWFARGIKNKIKILTDGTKAFFQKRFDYRIPVREDECYDELCRLGSSFNEMAASIEDLVEKQQKVNEILDSKVQEQTIKIRKNLEELEKTNMVVMDSINYASKIQHSLLPDRIKMKNTMGEHFVIWNQRDIVGGDFYWMEEVKDGFIVALIDCTGHGVPGSLMTMISVPALDRIIREHEITDPSMILGMLNRSIKNMLSKGENDLGDDGLDAGICYVNTKNWTVTFASAGIPLFYTKNKEIFEIKGEKKGIGYKDTDINHNFKNHSIAIDSSMSFYMATDGITEQVGGEKRRMMFGRKRLRELLKNIHVRSKYEQKEIILETLSQYRGDEPQKDDMTCISFKIDKEERI